jgi:coenzyme PQQ biosynthesis protein PqqD
MTLTAASVPALWRLARLDFDPVRQQRVLLYPEGVVLCDGHRSIGDVAAILQERYHRDVTADVIEYLSRLLEKELVRVE